MTTQTPVRIAFYCSLMAWPKASRGGVRPWTLRLANALAEKGYPVDVLSEAPRARFVDEPALSPSIRRIVLGKGAWALLGLLVYLWRNPGVRLVTALNRYNLRGALMKLVLHDRFHLTITQHENLSADEQWKAARKFRWNTRGVRHLFKHADAVVAVSHGVAADLKDRWRVPARLLRVIHNPAYETGFAQRGAGRPPHEWLAGSDVPVVLGAGRLHPVKGFDDLIRAFAILRARRAAKLIILGEGDERERLNALIHRERLGDDVDLPGRVADVSPWFSRAALFVLSSRREGFGNVLVEAMAAGLPIVATRCPSGPEEILEDGRWGALVDVGDLEAMAAAMERQLSAPHMQRAALLDRAAHFSTDSALRQYLLIWQQADRGIRASALA